jgi:hypothetical protein
VRADDKPSAEELQKAKKVVEEELAKLKVKGARVEAVGEEAVARALPGYRFVTVIFPQFPVARVPPEPLKSANIYALPKDGKPQLLTDPRALAKFCHGSLAAVEDEKSAQDAGRAWLRLTQELSQDGFYKFSIPDKSVKAVKEGAGWKVTGQVVVDQTRGDRGGISASLIFSKNGKLDQWSEDRRLQPGMRPRCQATKLLDPDPVVQAMAEQDLLILGRLGKEYLDEQRTKASPELRQAIDRIWKRIVEEGR